MECRNFLCDNHDIEDPHQCSFTDKRICKSRKRYNRVVKDESAGFNFYKERDKYYGRRWERPL